MKITFFSAFCVIIILSACGTSKYAATEKIYKEQAKAFAQIIKSTPAPDQFIEGIPQDQQFWVASVNFGIRKPNFVIIHHTAQDSLAQTIKTFHAKHAGVSSHYVVSRDGKVVQMVNDYLRANHAGVGKWGNDTDLNSSSIGIEMDNNGTTDIWTEAQIGSLLKLLAVLKKKYNIPQANFIGHADIAPSRKPDPANFPWQRLAQEGYGFWYDDLLVIPPDDFKPEIALRLMGYDTRNLSAAIIAFKRHFVQTDLTDKFSPLDLKILYNVYVKYL